MSESRPRILVFAYNEVGYACLSELLDRGANVVGVFTYRDDPAEEIWFSSVERLALESDLDVFTPPDVDDSARRIIRDLAPDLILSFYYRSMLPKDILEIPRLGAFTTLHGERIFVWKALPHSEPWRDLPGSVVSLSPLRVVTGNGILEIVRLQPEGEEEIDGAIFAEYNLTHDSRFGQ